VLIWDDSTTPPTLLRQQQPWKAVSAGAPMHPFFLHRDKLYRVPSITEPCIAELVFDHQP